VPCVNYIGISETAKVIKGGKEKYSQTLKTDEQEFKIHMAGVCKYEEMYNLREGKVSATHLGMFGKTLKHLDSTRNVGQINLGVHWPEPLYESFFSKKMDQNKAQWEDYGTGALVKGIVLSDTQGSPTGTKKLFREVSRGVEMETYLGDSSSELRQGQLKEMHKLAKSAIEVQTVAVRKKDQDGNELDSEEEGLVVQHKKMKRSLEQQDSNTSQSMSCDWLRAPGKAKSSKASKKTKKKKDSSSSGRSDNAVRKK
jgi:hypothetical protein